MKYIKLYTIIIFITVIVLVCGCTDMSQYVPLETYNNEVALYENQLEKANNTIDIRDSNIADLEEEKSTLETDLDLTGVELEKYRSLINNLNELLSCVYYMECENSEYTNWGTGFSIKYDEQYYILTAGHYLEDTEYNTGKYYNFKFKVNNEWIYPELLIYEITDTTPDYAIFYSDKIKSGLDFDINNSEPDYRLGIDKLIQENNNWGIDGECGSPIIDLNGEVIGIHVGYLSDIDDVIEAIDNLK